LALLSSFHDHEACLLAHGPAVSYRLVHGHALTYRLDHGHALSYRLAHGRALPYLLDLAQSLAYLHAHEEYHLCHDSEAFLLGLAYAFVVDILLLEVRRLLRE